MRYSQEKKWDKVILKGNLKLFLGGKRKKNGGEEKNFTEKRKKRKIVRARKGLRGKLSGFLKGFRWTKLLKKF